MLSNQLVASTRLTYVVPHSTSVVSLSLAAWADAREHVHREDQEEL